MKNKLLLPFVAGVFLAISSSCESELEEVKPVETIEVTKENIADTDGLKTKIFFPKDPDK